MNSRISVNPPICHGKPCTEGTRVLVSSLLGAIAGSDSVEGIADDDSIVIDDVRACVFPARDGGDMHGS